jgi:TonB family protein
MMHTHTTPRYSSEAVRRREQGATMLSVTIDKDGIPSEISVLHSSGSTGLDNEAIDWIKARWRWQSISADCTTTSASQKVLYIWRVGSRPPKADIVVTVAASQLPNGAVERYESGDTYLSLTLDDSGDVMDDRVIYSSGYDDLDKKALTLFKSTPGILAGQTAGKKIVVARWKLPKQVLDSIEAVVVQATTYP